MKKAYTAKELAEILKGELVGNENITISGVNGLDNATENELSFLSEKKYYKKVANTKAPILIVPQNFDMEVPEGKAWIKCEIPNIAFSTVINIFAPAPIEYPKGIHPRACVAETAQVDPTCHVGANAVIGEHAVVGKNSKICAGAVICEYAKIGENTIIYPCTVVRDYCEIGSNCILHPNVSIGGDGFGFTPTPFGIQKIPQVGIAKIEDDVEIGSNSTVDRARFGKTWIKTGVKIDDQVVVGHNCTIGEFSIFAGQTGLAGSATIGQGVICGAKSGINGHIKIGDGARIAPCAIIKDEVAPGEERIGVPGQSPREFAAQLLAPKNIDRLKKKVKELEDTVKALTEKMEELSK